VRGYEQDGKQILRFTDFAGLYQRSDEHDNKPPFDMPQRWIDKKTDLNLATHLDFVSDADIIGGNSGSPVVNKSNEFVGIIFDGNIQSLVLDCIYTDTQARAVSVDSAAITEALRKVYDAGALADELLSVNKSLTAAIGFIVRLGVRVVQKQGHRSVINDRAVIHQNIRPKHTMHTRRSLSQKSFIYVGKIDSVDTITAKRVTIQ